MLANRLKGQLTFVSLTIWFYERCNYGATTNMESRNTYLHVEKKALFCYIYITTQ